MKNWEGLLSNLIPSNPLHELAIGDKNLRRLEEGRI